MYKDFNQIWFSCIVLRVRIKIRFDLVYFYWSGAASCSVFCCKILLRILFANCEPGYISRWWWSEVYLWTVGVCRWTVVRNPTATDEDQHL